MIDPIEREDALQALVDSDVRGYDYRQLEKAIKAIPSADRPQGEWILQDDEHHIEKIYLCSNCENFEAWGEYEKYNYCPNCGARMKGADDE